MPRTKQFDPEDVLRKAVEAFWDNGYAKTSLDTLIAEMGIARQSLYDTFGDKRALYLRALAHYRDANHAALRRLFDSGQSVRQCFTELLAGLCSESKSARRRGCLLLSANLERERDDEEIAKLLKDNQAAIETIFERALRRAQASGELSADRDPRALARFFVTTIQGMRAFARVDTSSKSMEQVAAVALTALD
ncbi:MAG TPA: TetR family transcriptional regulator [Burkholderiales bacterium]|nr:TetR family transcriptional regulator [Burkholderiales bacterium]